jgi:hypothetical protein
MLTDNQSSIKKQIFKVFFKTGLNSHFLHPYSPPFDPYWITSQKKQSTEYRLGVKGFLAFFFIFFYFFCFGGSLIADYADFIDFLTTDFADYTDFFGVQLSHRGHRGGDLREL